MAAPLTAESIDCKSYRTVGSSAPCAKYTLLSDNTNKKDSALANMFSLYLFTYTLRLYINTGLHCYCLLYGISKQAIFSVYCQ